MRYLNVLTLVSGVLFAAAGCDSLAGLLSPNVVTVMLVNTTAYSVDAEIHISDDNDVRSFLPTAFGDERQVTILPGLPMSFTSSCDDLQAIVITDADLRLIGELGPEANTDVLRDGEDFNCGDQIVFTFSYDESVLDFDISWQAR